MLTHQSLAKFGLMHMTATNICELQDGGGGNPGDTQQRIRSSERGYEKRHWSRASSR